MPAEILSPVGRIVWGHPLKAQKQTDDDGKPKLDDDGVQKLAWSFGLAIPKTEATEVFAAMTAAASEEYPGGFPNDFAWKYKDGDTGVDAKGNPLNAKPGYAGCVVLAVTTYYQAPPFYVYDYVKSQYVPAEADKLKTGDYVRVQLQFVGHKPASPRAKPGLYVNPQFVLFYEAGEEIKGVAADPNALGIAAPPKPAAPPAAGPGVAGIPGAGPGAAPGAGPGAAPHHAFVKGPQPG